MFPDAFFRLALLLILLCAIPWAGYHRFRAERAGGPISRAAEGRTIFALLRLSGLGAWGIVIAYMINPRSVAFASMPLAMPLRWVGLAIVAAGFVWLGWMFRALGLNVTDTVAARPNGTLVTTGPYRYVRHPMYVGLIPIIGGLALVTTNWIVAVCGIIAMVTLVFRTRIEEQHLLARYGEEYRAYMARVGGFFPRVSHSSQGERRGTPVER